MLQSLVGRADCCWVYIARQSYLHPQSAVVRCPDSNMRRDAATMWLYVVDVSELSVRATWLHGT
jgi:hypothetical protein